MARATGGCSWSATRAKPTPPWLTLPGLETALAQSMSLMGQDRSLKPDLAAVLREAGLSRGQTIGVVGWKYFEPAEWGGPSPGLFVPHYLVALLSRIAGGPDALTDVTPVLMHPVTGLRSTIDADQIALHEWGAARASASLWRIVTGTRLGVTEFEAASRMGYAGEVLSAHVMFATGDPRNEVIGLRSPGGRIVRRGDGVAAAIGFWGGLSARGGLVADHDEAFLKCGGRLFRRADRMVRGGGYWRLGGHRVRGGDGGSGARRPAPSPQSGAPDRP